MKKITVFILTILALNASARAAKIDPELVSFARSESTKKVGVLIVMNNLSQGLKTPRRYNHREIVSYLRNAAAQTRGQFDAYLARVPNAKRNFVASRFYYSTLVYAAMVTPEGLRIVSQYPGVTKVYANRKIFRDPVALGLETSSRASEAEYPYDLTDIALDQLREKYSELDGTGVVLGSVDTGVDGKHPALAGKIKLFFNGDTRRVGEPKDSDRHGTHTIGTMIGTGKDGAPMGVAPGAKMISAGALNGYDAMLAGMEFMLDPDQDPETKDQPRAVNNSWHAGGAPDMELFYRAINAWEAAGVMPIFSAGNSGPRGGSITRPKEHPLAFAVAATGMDGKIANFSSRGPAVFNGETIEKPNLAAPGVDIVSSVPGGEYVKMSGTSMAAPHVTGSTALLFQVDPNLNPEQVRSILMKTTQAVDETGVMSTARAWNKVYGMGKLNIFEAVKLAKGVTDRRSGFFANVMERFIASPFSQEIADVLKMGEETSVDIFNFPAGEEGTTWVDSSVLF